MYVYIAYIKRNYVLFNNFIIHLTHSLSLQRQRQRWQMRQNGASFRQVNLVSGLRLALSQLSHYSYAAFARSSASH